MIRFATPADVARIAEIHVQTWRAAYRDIVPESVLASLSVDRRAEEWRRGIDSNPKLVLVAEHGGRIDGWVAVGRGRDEDARSDGEIYALYVSPERWQQGLGRALMQEGEEELWRRGVPRIVLWVLEQNDRARRFYDAAGYRPDGRDKDVRFDSTMLRELRYEKAAVSR